MTFRRRALGLLAAVFVLPVALGVWSVTGASALSAHRLGFVALVMVMLAAGVLAWNLFRYEERLGEERNVLQAIIEGTSDGIFVKDRDGRFLLVNSAFAGLHDLTVADVVGRHENEVFPAHASFFLEEDARVMASGIAYASEFTDQSRGRRITTITSKTPFRDRDGHVRGVIGITRDISARKRAEDDLRETLEGLVQERTGELQSANAILQAVIEGTTDLVFVKDAEGRYLLLNTAVARNSGCTAEEILGRDDRVLFPTDLAGRFRDHDLEVMRTGEVKTFEEHVPSSGGTTRTLLTTKAPYRDAVGKTIGIIGIGRDITEHKQTEEAVRRTQKLESLGLLAGGVAHDFNNLLVAILGQTSLGLSRLPSDSPARANLEKAVRAAERAADLTRQMLAYSGRGHFQVTTVDLNALILDNLHLFEVAVPKNVRLRSELEPSLPWIDADVGQIQQVVMNLITNAAEAIGERPGTVTVTTGNRVVGGRDEALWRHTGEPLAPGTYVTLEVEDDGQGMSPAVRERMFDPFFTTKFTGRGLGLAAVLGIVRGHKGGLQVESEAGRGTHFRLVFPRSERSPVSREPALAAALAATGTVLVIDDEEVVREAVADALESEGIRYRLASDGDSGVALFREHGHDIGLVLLDLSMPGRSGEETFQELRRLDAGIPVLLSSGFAEEEARGRFAPEDLAGFLQKPYRFPTLVAEVKRCLRPRA